MYVSFCHSHASPVSIVSLASICSELSHGGSCCCRGIVDRLRLEVECLNMKLVSLSRACAAVETAIDWRRSILLESTISGFSITEERFCIIAKTSNKPKHVSSESAALCRLRIRPCLRTLPLSDLLLLREEASEYSDVSSSSAIRPFVGRAEQAESDRRGDFYERVNLKRLHLNFSFSNDGGDSSGVSSDVQWLASHTVITGGIKLPLQKRTFMVDYIPLDLTCL